MRAVPKEEWFHSSKRKGFCPCCMGDPMCAQELVFLDYDTGWCEECHNESVRDEYMEFEV